MNMNKTLTALHNHTEQSARDSAEKIETLVKRAKELGYTSLALTNHGIMMGNYQFVKVCEKEGINPIPAVEGYLQGLNGVVGYSHICLYAPDYESYSYVGQAITDAGNNIKGTTPVLTMEMLEKYFGENSPAHGKVMITTACVGGILAKQMFANEEILESIDSVKAKIDELGFDGKAYVVLKAELDKLLLCQGNMTELKKELQAIAKKTYLKERKAVEKLQLKNSPEYEEKKEELDNLLSEQVEKKRQLLETEEQLKTLNAQIKEKRAAFNKAKDQFGKYDSLVNKLDELESQKCSEEDMYANMKIELDALIDIFGKDNIYLEIQNHGLEKEKYAFQYVVKLAKEMDMKMCCANDAHFAYPTKENVRARQLLLSLRFDSYVKEEPDHKEYYLKSVPELREALLKIYDEDVVDKAFEGNEEIGSKCHFSYPKEKFYPEIKDADKLVRQMAYDGIKDRYPNDWDEEKKNRLEYELSEIEKLKVPDYIYEVAEFIRWTKENAKDSYPIGPGRGSSAGSIVCYLTKITNIDPMKYGLIFERFLNPERVTMPDIDTDISEEMRAKAIQHMRDVYGEESVCSIMTELTMGAKQSIRNVAKFLGMEEGNPQKYYELGDAIAKCIPNEVGASIKQTLDSGLFSNIKHPKLDEIVSLAMVVEGTLSSYSLHAAGVIVSKGKVSSHIPLRYNTSQKAWGCQCNMIEAEEMGFLKIDFLGLKTLDILTKCKQMVKRNRGINVDLDNIPFEDDVFRHIYSAGDTMAVFQVEGPGMKSMLKELKPDCIEDIIAGISLYRPGPMEFIPKYIEGKKNPKKVTYTVPETEHILKDTYGCIVYQEQVMEMVCALAGYSRGRSDLVRKYMSKKKTELLLKEREYFVYGNEELGIKGCVANGIDEGKALKLFDEMTDFGKYAFNKSHAASYAIVSYQTAYMKYHYPEEFYASVMSVVNKKKLPQIIYEVKKKGIKIKTPSINDSSMDFDARDGEIIFGFKGINDLATMGEDIISKAPYSSFKDYLLRGHSKINTTEALINAGAFDEFTSNRLALKESLTVLVDLVKTIKKKEAELEEKKASVSTDDTKAMESIKRAEKTLNEKKQFFYDYIIDDSIYEDKAQRLENEYAVIGVYLSGHPLDNYDKPDDAILIADLQSGKDKKAYGVIKNLSVKRRKKDNAEFCFFTLEDMTGSIEVACFTKEFVKFKEDLAENKVIALTGNVQIKERDIASDNDEDVEVEMTFNLKGVDSIEKRMPTIVIHIPSVLYYAEYLADIVEVYREYNGGGCKLVFHDRLTGELREYKYPVSPKICTMLRDENISISTI